MNSYTLDFSLETRRSEKKRVLGRLKFLRKNFSEREWGAVSESEGSDWEGGRDGESAVWVLGRFMLCCEDSKKVGYEFRDFKGGHEEAPRAFPLLNPGLFIRSYFDYFCFFSAGYTDSRFSLPSFPV